MNQPLRVIFFGDSVCVGQGVAIHKGWVTRCSEIITEMGEKYDKEILTINSSINGSTTRQALERMPYDVQSHGVNILVIQFGMNDCNYWASDNGVPRVSPNAFAANLEEIINRGIKFGASKIFLHTNHPTRNNKEVFANTKITYECSNRLYNQIIRELGASDKKRIVLHDMEEYFDNYVKNGKGDLNDLLLNDGLHLNSKGHDLYYKIITPQLIKSLKRMIDEYKSKTAI